MAAENIITPNITNGVTITIMAIIGFTLIVLIAQTFHWSLGKWGGQ